MPRPAALSRLSAPRLMLVSAVIVLVGRQSWEVLPLALLGIAVATRKLLRRATPPFQKGTMT